MFFFFGGGGVLKQLVQVSLDTIQFVPTFDAIKAAFDGKEARRGLGFRV